MQATRACAIMFGSTIAHLLEQLSVHSVVQVLLDFFVQVSNFCASTCAVHRVRGNVLYSVFIFYVSADERRVLYSLNLLHGQLEGGHSCVLSLVFSLSLIAGKLS